MPRRSSRKSYNRFYSNAHRENHEVVDECPAADKWEWGLFVGKASRMQDAPVARPIDPRTSLLISEGWAAIGNQRLELPAKEREKGEHSGFSVDNIEHILSGHRSISQRWETDILPPKEYPIGEPQPLAPPPPCAKPVRTAGLRPKKPTEDEFGLRSSHFLDVVFGAKRRARNRPLYEDALKVWRNAEDDWQLLDKEDQANQERYQTLIALYKAEVSKAQSKFDEVHARWSQNQQNWNREREQIVLALNDTVEQYRDGDPTAAEAYFSVVLRSIRLHRLIPRHHAIKFDVETGLLLVELQLPNLLDISVTKSGANGKPRVVGKRDHKIAHEEAACAVAIRSLFEISAADTASRVASICLNGWIEYVDPADGHTKKSYLISVISEPETIRALNISRVDPKQAIKSLSGRVSPDLSEMVGIPPVLTLDKKDHRIIETDFSLDEVDRSTNLAAMDWEEFEGLTRELFGMEFGSEGAEVKVTRASRDGGVDAIAWDPDAIRGGKFVIQAKRYTNTVGVAAVRDLYGTVINEGATRGILVSTSGYGPDAVKFASNKPITLIDGPGLIGMLKKHGYSFRIDLDEAKRLAARQPGRKQRP